MMRRVVQAVILAPGLFAAGGCVPEEPKPAEATPPPPTVQATARLPVDPELKRAVHRVYAEWCASGRCADDYRAAAALVEGAGAGILPVLAELVADRGTNNCLVHNALWVALEYPLSVELRAALRTRRDRHGGTDDMLRYFAKFGDETDLLWMEKAVGELCEEDRPGGEKHLRQLRARLATN